jgi:hypothetical protein
MHISSSYPTLPAFFIYGGFSTYSSAGMSERKNRRVGREEEKEMM